MIRRYRPALRRGVAVGLLTGVALLMLSAPAQAHPLGNFTTNQYAGLRVSPTGIDIEHLLDLAEIPAYQAVREEIDTDADGDRTPAERDAYATRTCAAIGAASALTVEGVARPLTSRPAGLSFPAGAGGLDTLRLQCVLHADVRITGTAVIGYRTDLFADRVGWREITAVGDRYTLLDSTVPAETVSARLTAYPAGAPTRDVRSARLTVRPGGPAAAAAPFATTEPRAGDVDRVTAWFTDLVGRPRLTVGVGILAVVVALVLGAGHAVAPGHGKTIMAAYLIGADGRRARALVVAVTVAVTHTLGVLVLGVVLATSLQVAPSALYGWLRLASGVLVAVVGAHLLWRAVRHPRHAPAPHTHDSAGHTHGSAGHTHGGAGHHHHHPTAGQHVSVRSTVAMGFAGGLTPSPSAVVVLLGAAALGRAWYGVLLVLAYGIGLAATLTGIGFALAHWGERIRGAARWSRIPVHRLPALTAVTLLAIGAGMIVVASVDVAAAR